jgi:hypothetical protein
MSAAAPRQALPWLAASVLIFCGAPLLLAGLVLDNVLGGFDALTTAEAQETLTATMLRQMQHRQNGKRGTQDLSTIYLTSPTATLARAELEDRAARLVEQAGGRLIETQILDTPELQTDGRVAVELTLEIANAGLLTFLHEAETSLPLMTVPDITVRTGNAEDSSRAAGDALQVTMVLHAALRKGTP